MNPFNLLIVFVALFLSCHSFSKEIDFEDTLYSAPVYYKKSSVNNIEDVILFSMRETEWRVKSKEQNKITAWIENSRNHRLVIDMTYNDNSIQFKHVSFQKVNCVSSCSVSKNIYVRWRLYLRKRVIKNLHAIEMGKLLVKTGRSEKWVDIIHSGKLNDKVALSKKIISYAFYHKAILNEIQRQFKSNYARDNLTGHDIKLYAWFGKVLIYSQKDEYRSLMIKAKNETPSSKLQSYLESYFEKSAWREDSE